MAAWWPAGRKGRPERLLAAMGPQVAKWPDCLISGNGGFHGGKWWSQHEDGLAIAFASEDLQKEEKIALMAVKSNTARALGVWQMTIPINRWILASPWRPTNQSLHGECCSLFAEAVIRILPESLSRSMSFLRLSSSKNIQPKITQARKILPN